MSSTYNSTHGHILPDRISKRYKYIRRAQADQQCPQRSSAEVGEQKELSGH